MGNHTLLCHDASKIQSDGLWRHQSPLLGTVPLLLMQLTLISVTSKMVEYCLRPLQQSIIVSQILGGMVLGPSFLGRASKSLALTIFPLRGTMIIETVATFGLMFFLFAIAVKMDAKMMLRPGRMGFSIGLSALIFSFFVPVAIAFTLKAYIVMDPFLVKALPIIAGTQSLTSFTVIACLLAELKIVNTEVGNLAISSSMFCDLLGISLEAALFAVFETQEIGFVASFGAISSTISLVLTIIFIIRPILLIIVDLTSEGEMVKEFHFFIVILSVLVCGLVSEYIGQHYFLGPIVLGLVLPDTSPLGAIVVSKLDTFVSGLLYPTFLTVSGLKTNIFSVQFETMWITGIIVASSCLVKVIAVMVPAMFGSATMQEAFVLGLIMNAKGIHELIIYNLCFDDGVLTDQGFTMLVISVLMVMAALTPLIRVLYDPSSQYHPPRSMSIQHSKDDIELKVLVCIHNEYNVPTIINLLQISHAAPETPLAIIVLILIQIVGRSAPMLVAHRPHRALDRSSSQSSHICNAFQHYEMVNEGAVTVQIFTNTSPYSAMHDDICRVAVDKRANLLIVPFHKQWAIDGSIEKMSRNIQAMNVKLVDKAPCSLGILVDRGPIKGSVSFLSSQFAYQVVVIFIGGADDVESLAYGARMACNPTVMVTVIRFLLLGNGWSRERKHDDDIISNCLRNNVGNERFLYREEYVRDGIGMAAAIRCLEDRFDLIIVGRNHPQSPIFYGLDMWSECRELGVIGDMLAAPNTGSTASVLVIQQQRLWKSIKHSMFKAKSKRDLAIHDVPDDGVKGGSDHVAVPIPKLQGSSKR
ncbi:hypothetical protein Ancab_034544 [Ancistrocladus abbreviatus]